MNSLDLMPYGSYIMNILAAVQAILSGLALWVGLISKMASEDWLLDSV